VATTYKETQKRDTHRKESARVERAGLCKESQNVICTCKFVHCVRNIKRNEISAKCLQPTTMKVKVERTIKTQSTTTSATKTTAATTTTLTKAAITSGPEEDDEVTTITTTTAQELDFLPDMSTTISTTTAATITTTATAARNLIVSVTLVFYDRCPFFI